MFKVIKIIGQKILIRRKRGEGKEGEGGTHQWVHTLRPQQFLHYICEQ